MPPCFHSKMRMHSQRRFKPPRMRAKKTTGGFVGVVPVLDMEVIVCEGIPTAVSTSQTQTHVVIGEQVQQVRWGAHGHDTTQNPSEA